MNKSFCTPDHIKDINVESLPVSPSHRKIYFDASTGTTGFGNTYGEHSYNFLPRITSVEWVFDLKDIISLGDSSYKKGEFEKAESFYKHSYDISKRGKNIPTNDLITAEIDIKIGRLYTQTRRYIDALRYLEEASMLFERIGSRADQIEPLGIMGQVYIKMGEKDKAEEFNRRLLEITKSINESTVKKGIGLHYAGKYYQSIAEYDKSFQLLNKALFIFRANEFEYGIASVYNNIGIHYYKEKDSKPELAVEYFKKAKSIFRKLGFYTDELAVEQNINVVDQECMRS